MTIMTIALAIGKLKTTNQGINLIRENVHEQLGEIGSNPKLEGLTVDLENLFESYLDTWMKSNSEVLEILEKAQ